MPDKPGLLRILLTAAGYALFSLVGWTMLVGGFMALFAAENASENSISLAVEVAGGAMLLGLHYLK